MGAWGSQWTGATRPLGIAEGIQSHMDIKTKTEERYLSDNDILQRGKRMGYGTKLSRETQGKWEKTGSFETARGVWKIK